MAEERRRGRVGTVGKEKEETSGFGFYQFPVGCSLLGTEKKGGEREISKKGRGTEKMGAEREKGLEERT